MSNNSTREITAGIIAFCAVVPAFYAADSIIRQITITQISYLNAMFFMGGVSTVVASWLIRSPLIFSPNLSLVSLMVFTMYLGGGLPYTQVLSVFFLTGFIVFLFGITGAGRALFKSVPESLFPGFVAATGLLLFSTGLREAGIVTAHPVTIMTVGDFTTRGPAITIVAVLIFTITRAKGFKMPLLWAGLAAGFTGTLLGVVPSIDINLFTIPQIKSYSILESTRLYFSSNARYMPSITLIIIIETLALYLATMAFTHQTDTVREKTRHRIWLVTGTAGIISPFTGVPGPLLSVEGFIAKLAGATSGRAGVITGMLLLLCPFIPIPAQLIGTGYHIGNNVWLHPITASLLLSGGLLSMVSLSKVDWKNVEVAIPTAVIIVLTPLAFSIVTGVGSGIVIYAIIRLAKGEVASVSPLLVFLIPLLLLRYLLL